MPRVGREVSERGGATVLSVAVIGVLMLTTVGGLGLASAVEAAHRARAAADLGALAAAGELQRSGSLGAACSAAAVLVARNGARLTGCGVSDDGSVTVDVAAAVRLRVAGIGGAEAVARARAGPGR